MGFAWIFPDNDVFEKLGIIDNILLVHKSVNKT